MRLILEIIPAMLKLRQFPIDERFGFGVGDVAIFVRVDEVFDSFIQKLEQKQEAELMIMICRMSH